MLGVFLGRVGGYAVPARDRTAGRGSLPASHRRTDARRRRSPSTCCSSCVAYYAAYRLRFEQTYAVEQPLFVASLPFVVAAKMVAFAMLRTYQGLWRHTSLDTIVRLAQAVVLGGVLSVLASSQSSASTATRGRCSWSTASCCSCSSAAAASRRV